jgi:preprotein translocase subunit SecF
MLVLLKLGPSAAFDNWRNNRPSGVGRFLARLGAFSARRYPLVLTAFVIISAIAAAGAMQLRVDRSQVDNFAPDEEIRIADEYINSTFAGTAFLDIIVETNVEEGLLDTERMQRIAMLQEYLEGLPHVRKSMAITDYLSLMHHAVEEHSAGEYAERQLPAGTDGIAQYLFLYEISGDPTDFEEEIDYDYGTALIRGVLDTHYFSQSREVVESLQRYIDTEFNSDDLTATLAGDVTISYHWMSRLEQSHFVGLALSLVLVLLTSMLVFRSVTAGIIAVVPVTFAVLTLYAVMGYAGIYLEPATSMFAAIAIGVGVDFGIHLVDRLRNAETMQAGDTAAIVDNALPPTARACFFNSAALALGFSVLMASNLPTLQRFGGLVTVAAMSSYVAALIIVPALYAAERAVSRRVARSTRRLATRSVVACMIVMGSLFFMARADAADPRGMEIARQIAERPEGRATSRSIDITLTNKRGKTRTQSAVLLRESTDKARYTRITYVEPKRIRGTSLLSHDYHADEMTDLNWGYAPVIKRPRSLPPSERGDYFGGTDFTNEDMQSELKFDLSDYAFDYLGTAGKTGRVQHRITGTPRNRDVAKQLGYGRMEATVDEQSWIPVRIEFFDLSDEPLKTVSVTGIRNIEGVWTAMSIRASNHQTGHSTEFRFRDVDYVDDLDDQLFLPDSLARRLAMASAGGSR